jgi:hypothetical protein
MNTSSFAEAGVVRFYDNSGMPLALRMTGAAAAVTSVAYSIPPAGFLRLVTDGSSPNTNVGWARIENVTGSPPFGIGIFGLN